MPTKRTPIHRGQRGRITPQAIQIYKQIEETKSALSDLRTRLCRSLGRPEPWRTNPIDTVNDTGPPSYCNDLRDWHEANEIREALEEAVRSSEWQDDVTAARKTRAVARDEA